MCEWGRVDRGVDRQVQHHGVANGEGAANREDPLRAHRLAVDGSTDVLVQLALFPSTVATASTGWKSSGMHMRQAQEKSWRAARCRRLRIGQNAPKADCHSPTPSRPGAARSSS